MLKIIPFKHRQPKPPIPHCLHITDEVANQIENTIGSLPAETGGFLGTSDGKNIDHFYFDHTAETSAVTYTPNVVAVNRKLKEWSEAGVRLVGNIHSHPEGYSRITTSLWHALELPEHICRSPIPCLKPRFVILNSSGMTLFIWLSALHLLMDGWIHCCS